VVQTNEIRYQVPSKPPVRLHCTAAPAAIVTGPDGVGTVICVALIVGAGFAATTAYGFGSVPRMTATVVLMMPVSVSPEARLAVASNVATRFDAGCLAENVGVVMSLAMA